MEGLPVGGEAVGEWICEKEAIEIEDFRPLWSELAASRLYAVKSPVWITILLRHERKRLPSPTAQ